MLKSLTLSLTLWLIATPAFAGAGTEDCIRDSSDGTVAGCGEAAP